MKNRSDKKFITTLASSEKKENIFDRIFFFIFYIFFIFAKFCTIENSALDDL